MERQTSTATRCWLVLATIVLTWIIYAPVLHESYGFYDDYPYLQMAQDPDQSLFFVGLRQGRPLTGLSFQLGIAPIDEIDSYRFLRAAAIAFASVFAALVLCLCIRFGVRPAHAFLLSIAFVSLPSFQVYAAWSVCYLLPVAASLGLLSGFLWTRSLEAGSSRWSGKRRWLLPVLSLALFITGLAIYQPAAMLVWFFPAFRLLAGNLTFRESVRFMAATFIMILAGLVAGYLILKVGVLLYGAHDAARSGITADPIGKLRWLAARPLRHAALPWALEPSTGKLVWIIPIVLIGLFLRLQSESTKRFHVILWIPLLLLCSYTPNIVTEENWSSFRTQVAFGGVSIIVYYLALTGWSTLLRSHHRQPFFAATAFVVLLLCFQAQRNIFHLFVVPQSWEWRFLKGEVRQGLEGNPDIKRIVGIPSTWQDSITGRVHYDEFGLPSSAQPWMPVPMIQQALVETGFASRAISVEGIHAAESTEHLREDTLIVDFRKLRLYR